MELLEKLINADGISGNESQVREIIKREIGKYVDEVRIDNVGNLIARKRGGKPTVMLAAHMDEIGLMVKRISKDGRIYFSTVGGIDSISLIGQRVRIENKIGGVITTKEIAGGIDVEELPKSDELYVDAGVNAKELKKKGIEVGDYISFDQCMFCLLDSTAIISGKALDDRIGCYALIELAKKLKNNKNEIYYVFTVQEEIGLYGAKISAYEIVPDWAVVVDVTEVERKNKVLGGGPCLTIKDAEMLGNRCINRWLRKIAKKNGIKLQLDVSDIGTTDALSISLSKGGIPTTSIGIAIKNIHTAVSMAHKRDVDQLIKLAAKLLKKPPKVCVV